MMTFDSPRHKYDFNIGFADTRIYKPNFENDSFPTDAYFDIRSYLSRIQVEGSFS